MTDPAAAVSQTDFVRIWQEASSVAEAARACGMAESRARSRAAAYRKAGVPLKRFASGRPALDVAGLKSVAKRHAPRRGAR